MHLNTPASVPPCAGAARPLPSTRCQAAESSLDFLPPRRSLTPLCTKMPLPGRRLHPAEEGMRAGKARPPPTLLFFFFSLKNFFGVLILEMLPRLILEKLLFCKLAGGGLGQG